MTKTSQPLLPAMGLTTGAPLVALGTFASVVGLALAVLQPFKVTNGFRGTEFGPHPLTVTGVVIAIVGAVVLSVGVFMLARHIAAAAHLSAMAYAGAPAEQGTSGAAPDSEHRDG